MLSGGSAVSASRTAGDAAWRWADEVEPWLLAQRDEAAIDDERLTGDVAGLVGEQERGGVGDFPPGALASERDRAVFATWVGFAREASK